MSEMKRRMLAGELYLADDPELAAAQARAQELQERYNATRHAEHELRDNPYRLMEWKQDRFTPIEIPLEGD